MGTDEDHQRRYELNELMRELIADVSERMAELYRDAAARRGEAPTSIAELWSTGRPSEHNPSGDWRPVALDIPLRAWCAPDEMWDLYAAQDAATRAVARATGPYPTEQLYDLTAPEMSTVGLPVVGPGEWTTAARDDFAAVYAAIDPGNDDTGEWENPKPCHAIDGIDPVFARLVVEDAMGRIGMRPPGRAGE